MNREEHKLTSNIKSGIPITWILFMILKLNLLKIKTNSPPGIVPKTYRTTL